MIAEVVATDDIPEAVPRAAARAEPADVGARALARVVRVSDAEVHASRIELGRRPHEDPVPANPADAVPLGATRHHLIGQVPHHAGQICDVDIAQRPPALVVLRAVQIECEGRGLRRRRRWPRRLQRRGAHASVVGHRRPKAVAATLRRIRRAPEAAASAALAAPPLAEARAAARAPAVLGVVVVAPIRGARREQSRRHGLVARRNGLLPAVDKRGAPLRREGARFRGADGSPHQRHLRGADLPDGDDGDGAEHEAQRHGGDATQH
mmetsp:Transcript_111261/g.321709  ORF Transcript_111261/g.321709 Transcript_111261/m.321709 type:complete len:266 (-) Transcript_111261:212-1009(-)